MMSDLSSNIDENWGKYPTLKTIVDANGGVLTDTIKNMDEYQNAK